ncbi:hypothetical protein QVD17_28316 [Tagetes erecta]|uniref:Uncharacterized protein n=1 Tax=Tagetes erecta TaxID=13708 RepID=A0AAD8KEU8_TARER|nr:hypothetical protein QVD17_28316 [Tagetes erecta]
MVMKHVDNIVKVHSTSVAVLLTSCMWVRPGPLKVKSNAQVSYWVRGPIVCVLFGHDKTIRTSIFMCHHL